MFAAEEKTLSPKCVTPVTTEIEMEIPYHYFSKIYSRSGLQKKYFLSCDGGVIDFGFHGTVLILMTSNSSEPFKANIVKELHILFYTKKKMLRLQKLNLWFQQKEEL